MCYLQSRSLADCNLFLVGLHPEDIWPSFTSRLGPAILGVFFGLLMHTTFVWSFIIKVLILWNCGQAGASVHAKTLGPKGSDPHKAAVIGDTIGDPLKDTSGPSLNILIKLMAVESLVFAPFFATHGGLIFKIF